jgi:hypothetical protein
VTANPGAIAGQQSAQAGEHAWRAMRAMRDVQFAPVPDETVVPPQAPEWLRAIFRFLAKLFEPLGRWLGSGWGVIETGLMVLAVVGVLWIAWNLAWPMWRDRRPRVLPATAAWAPAPDAAMALLEDADRLAAQGRFAEAAHLLLQRSVGHIATARPDWLTPSSTAREIVAIRDLPAAARQAFGVIAVEVERSLFALRGLSADDWQRARAAYADFALADLRQAAA